MPKTDQDLTIISDPGLLFSNLVYYLKKSEFFPYWSVIFRPWSINMRAQFQTIMKFI